MSVTDQWRNSPTAKIMLETHGSQGNALRVRGHTFSGAVLDFKVTTTSDRTHKTSIIPLPADLMSLIVSIVTGGAKRGEAFMTVSIIEQGEDLQDKVAVLCNGYVYDSHPLTWHWQAGGIYEHMTDGKGKLRKVTGTNPSAVATGDTGGEITEAVPTNARWKIHSVRFQIVTSATVGDRVVQLTFDDGTDEFYRTVDQIVIPASTTINITASEGLDDGWSSTDTTPDEHVLRLPKNHLHEAWRMLTEVSNKKMGDNIGAPIMMVEEWLEE